MKKRFLCLTGLVLASTTAVGLAWRRAHPSVLALPSPLLQQSVASGASARPRPLGVIHWREQDGLHGVEFTAEEIGSNYLMMFKPWVPPASELYALDDPQKPAHVELHHSTIWGSTVHIMADTSGVFTTTIPTAMLENSFFQSMRVLAWAAGANTNDPSQAFYDHDMAFALQ
jgi:hypothetical protein